MVTKGLFLAPRCAGITSRTIKLWDARPKPRSACWLLIASGPSRVLLTRDVNQFDRELGDCQLDIATWRTSGRNPTVVHPDDDLGEHHLPYRKPTDLSTHSRPNPVMNPSASIQRFSGSNSGRWRTLRRSTHSTSGHLSGSMTVGSPPM